MRARAWALSLLSSVAVLVVGWQAGTHEIPPTVTTSAAPPTGTAGAAAPPAATSTPAATPTASASSPSPQAPSGTFIGDSVSTAYGPVQVQITVSDGTITDVTALSLTDRDRHSVSISNRAAPMLRDEVLRAQSAHVDGVSGATYTTDGYLTSLQSALDKAGL